MTSNNPVATVQTELEVEETYDTSDPVAVNKVRKKSARTRADRLKFVEAAMSHEEGRAWFYDILLFCKLWDGEFRNDPYEAAFNTGKRNIGLRILDDIQTASPTNYTVMVGENKSKNG